MQILLIDDEKSEQVKIALKQHGHDVIHERDELRAEAYIKSQEFKKIRLVILDVAMKPPINLKITEREALETGKRLYRKIREVAAEIPIILYSGNFDLVDVSSLTNTPFTRAFDKANKDGHELADFIHRFVRYGKADVGSFA
jgi:DNA-binding response OmpR family regulator